MKYRLFYLIIILLCTGNIFSQPLAFPGAEGFGKNTSGGRGGSVIYVTNLNPGGPGSFREACLQQSARTILFRVSGTIFLKKTLNITQGNLTIAGQSAPGEGICIAGADVNIKADNVIIRFMRFRMGDINKIEGDALGSLRNKNIIIDHCSMSWSTDECASFYGNENFTLQWCIISESLANTIHQKGPHGFGGIWGGIKATFHHNLLAHHCSRTPRFGNLVESENMDFRNNVVYNWGYNNVYGGEGGEQNYVGNYYKPGPATQENVKNRLLQITKNTTQGYGSFYVDGNVLEGNPDVSKNNWNGIVISKGETDKMDSSDHELLLRSKATEPFEYEPINEQIAQEAYNLVLKQAGTNLHRDTVDRRIVNEVIFGKGTYGEWFDGGGNGIIDSQEQVGSWPELKSAEPPIDSDSDGIPDIWEKQNGLDPKNPDSNNFNLDANYTNLEVYLNSIVKM